MAYGKTTPIGYVELANGSKAIYPMNDIFLNYTFEHSEYWEVLRLTVNLLIEAYRQKKPDTGVKPIEGNIEVRTQFQHLLEVDVKTSRKQDIKMITNEGEATYIEFQNRAKPDIPVEIRSVEYFGLGIGHGRGKLANQIWLLAEDVESVLYGETFTRYILKDEVTGNRHPTPSGIIYISLTKLSEEDTPDGELAAFLLAKNKEPKNEIVIKIADAFKKSFDVFKADKEVAKMLTLAERYKHDGVVEGKIEGKIEIANKARELYEKGIDPNEILRIIIENAPKSESQSRKGGD